MSVYLVNTDIDEGISDSNGASSTNQANHVSEATEALIQFWPRVTDEIKKIQNLDPRCQTLPLARIKKIMKLDEDVKMISAEAPVLFAKAAELFIHELTLRAWMHTEDNKRRTLQRNDIAMAISKYDQFDFLIDIVPRDEVKVQSGAPRGESKAVLNADQVQYYFQLAQQHQAALQSGPNTTQSTTQVPVQVVQPTQLQAVTTLNTQDLKTALQGNGSQLVQVQGGGNQQTAAIQLVQQVVTPSGEVQHVPIQLNSNQMQMIRMQVAGGGGGGGQPIILQSSHSSSQQPHILQVSPSAGSTPVYFQSSNGSENE